MTAEVPMAPAPPAAAAGAGAPDGWRLRHVPVPLATSAVVLVAAAVVGGVAGGGAAAAGAAAGVALVTVGYLGSTLAIARADAVAPRLVMTVGLAAYVVKITTIGGVMLLLAALGWAGLKPMAWGIAAGVVAWTGAHIWWLTRRANQPRYPWYPPRAPG